MRTSAIVRSRLSPWNPGAMAAISAGVATTPTSTSAATTSASSDATAPATRSALALISPGEERGIDRNERRRERPLAEQVLQEVGNSKRRVERVGGVGLEAEIMGEDARADQAGEPAAEHAGRDQHGGAGRPRAASAAALIHEGTGLCLRVLWVR